MSTSAVSSHGALLAMEKDGDPTGTFTTIAEQTSEQAFEFSRRMTESTAHNDNIDSHKGGVLTRAPVVVQGNFLYNNDTHDETTGLQKRLTDGDLFGIRWRGPSGAASTDEIIGSAEVSNFRRTAPVRQGVYTFECTLQFSGPMIIDGTTIGA